VTQDGLGKSLPLVTTSLAPTEVVRRLDACARRGKLAGFEPGVNGELFSVAAFGEPIDYRLCVTARQSEPAACELHFSLRVTRKLPIIFWVIAALTVWPGVWLTESMLSTYWNWYASLPTWITYAWYLPLAVLPLPWLWARMLRKSRAAADLHAREQITRIASETGGVMKHGG